MASAKRPRSIPFIMPAERGPSSVDEAVDADAGFVVNPAALAVLASIRTPVAPVAVVGKYRTGKSFLLNKLMSTSGVFEVGPTVEACTRGIWLCTDVREVVCEDGTTMSIVFLDTEGLGAAGTTADHDARIFALACMLCSLMVYNSMGAVDEEAVSSLSFVAQLTQHIQLRAGGGTTVTKSVRTTAALEDAASDESADSDEDEDAHTHTQTHTHTRKGAPAGGEDGDSDDDDYVTNLRRAHRKKRAAAKRAQAARLREELQRSGARTRTHTHTAEDVKADPVADISTFFPTFLWVLRDFTLGLVDEDGQPISPHDYLEACLSQQEGFSTDAQARNRTRRILTNFFKERDCFTLVRPVDEEAQLQLVDTIPEAELRSEFQRQLELLRAKVFGELIRPKTMQGQFVTGRILGGLAQAYVAAINARAIPSIGSAWDGVSRVECKEALDSSYSSFASDFAAEVPAARLPMNQDELERAFEKHRLRAMEVFDSKAVGPSADRYRRELKEKINAEWKILSSRNGSASEEACTRVIARLWHANIEPRLLFAEGDAPPGSARSRSPRTAKDESVYANYEDFVSDMQRVRKEYMLEAKGPAVHRALADFLISAVPTVIRAINRARASEIDKRLSESRALIVSLQQDLQLATAKAAVFESQCADLRKERQTSAVERAKFEQEARSAREELQHLTQRLEDLEKERNDLNEKLRQERVAHAATRVAVRAGSGPDPAMTAAVAAKRPAAGSVDYRAILGADAAPAQIARPHARSDAMLRMRPVGEGASDIASPAPGHVVFPEPQPSGCGCVLM